MLSEIDYLTDMIQDLLLLSRLDAGHIELEKEFGDVDGPFFAVRLLGKVLFERVLKTDDAPFRTLVDKIEQMKGTIS